MKKKSLFCIILVLVITLQVLPGFVTAQSETDPVVTAGCNTLHAQLPLGGTQKKVDTAQSVILYELNTDTLLYAYNPDMKVNPTGLVKLLTALVAIETVGLDDEVTVKRSVLDTVAIGSVSAGLKAGEVVTVMDLLNCIMVASANDAAAVLANYVGGTQSHFAEMLNAKAYALGCTASNFVNAHGLMAENQYSTARDLAIIAEAALENPLFSQLFSAKECVIPETNKSTERKFHTTNHMMSDATIQTQVDQRVTGGKPAAASTDDRSMICTAEVGTSRYLCVVMSAAAEVSSDGLSITRWNIFEEVSFLLDFGFANYGVRQVIEADHAMYQYAVADGNNDVVVSPSASISVVLPLDYDPHLLQFINVVDHAVLHAPITKCDTLGTLQLRYDSVYIGQCDLVAMHDVLPALGLIEDAERVEMPEDIQPVFRWKPVLILCISIVGILVVGVVVVLVMLRVIDDAKLRLAHRRRARERRRERR